MTFWQENYPFIKDVYLMRQTKMVEWMENVEKSISRIMADKVYTSAEFKRERDNFHVSLTLDRWWFFWQWISRIFFYSAPFFNLNM